VIEGHTSDCRVLLLCSDFSLVAYLAYEVLFHPEDEGSMFLRSVNTRHTTLFHISEDGALCSSLYFNPNIQYSKSRDSAIGIAIDYRLDYRGVEFESQ
jgi:hypothetical protein